MTRTFKHLGYLQRLPLAYFLKQSYSKAAIAKELGVHRSTIYRELNRNTDDVFHYHALLAEKKARQRQLNVRQRKLDTRPDYKDYVVEKLKAGWSPEQIVGRMKLLAGRSINSHETIYVYIYSEQGIKEGLYQYLPRQRPKRFPRIARKKSSLIPDRTCCITQRLLHINLRTDVGHWEAGFMEFEKDIKCSLLTLHERKSRYLIAIKQPNHRPKSVAQNLISTLQTRYKGYIKSITFVNDIGFIQHKKITHFFNADTYFCQPYKSYQKGSIENGNRLLRSFFPRHLNPISLTQQQIDSYVYQLNDKPMKCLGYKTPCEVFREHTGIAIFLPV